MFQFKKRLFFILLLILSISFCFAQSQDAPEDGVGDSVSEEQTYLNQVKDVMGGESTSKSQSTKTADEQRKSGIGYYSYFRLIFTLLIICGAIYLVYFYLKKRVHRTSEAAGISSGVVLVQSLGVNKTVQIIHIGGKYLIVGVTNEAINLLSEITDEDEIGRLDLMEADSAVKSGASFSDLIKGFIGKKAESAEVQEEFDYEKDSLRFIREQNEKLKNGEF